MGLTTVASFFRTKAYIFIIIIGLVIYSSTFNVPFLFDDIINIVDNRSIKDLRHFTSPSTFLNNRSLGYLTFSINYWLGGLNVSGYHFVNLAIHITNALLVYRLAIALFQTPFFSFHKDGKSDRQFVSTLALSSSLIFLCHPIQTGAVTYIVQRFTLLATFFYLISAIMFIMARIHLPSDGRWQSARFVVYYVISLLSTLLAMKCKEISFTLPVIIIIIELLFFEASSLTRIYLLFPFLATLVIIPFSLLLLAAPSGNMIQQMATVTQNSELISRYEYFLTQSRVIVTYIRLLLLPVGQNIDYDYPVIHSPLQLSVLASFVLHSSAMALTIILLKISKSDNRYRVIAFGIVWFYVTLAVESSFIPLDDVIFEHRLYLPSIGMMLSGTTGLIMVSDRVPGSYAGVVRLLIAATVISLSIATFARNTLWQSGLSLWYDAAQKSPLKPRPNFSLASYLANSGELDAAIDKFRKAINLEPGNSMGHNNLGHALLDKGDLKTAIEEFQQAIALDQENVTARRNLGAALAINGELVSAIIELRKAVQVAPDDAKAHNNLGYTLYLSGDIEEAIKEYQETLKIDPTDSKAQSHLKDILEHQNRSSQPRVDRFLQNYKEQFR